MIRLSGPDARAIALTMLQLRQPLQAGRVRLAKLVDPVSDALLDEAVVSFYAAPSSYTTEDVVEVACHGAPVLLQAVLRGLIAAGARLAEPGEFTQRAFLAGRLDLTQAEAVHDLVEATTLQQARVAAAQVGGSLARQVAPMKRSLIELIAALEAGVDFAEDDLDLMPESEISSRIEALRDPLGQLVASYEYGRVLRDGFTLAIVGRPNAGKSSLFNRLLQRDRAIVTDQPGTTRDSLTERLSLEGIPLELVDTAGIRSVPDGREGEVEKLGIERTSMAMAAADLILEVLDGEVLTAAGESFDDLVLNAPEGIPKLTVVNKSDLPNVVAMKVPEGTFRTSAKTGEGIAELGRAIVMRLTARHSAPAESTTVTNARQHAAISHSQDALEAALTATRGGVPHEMVLLDLYRALEGMDRLTGATTSEDVLNLIFSSFCIGK